MFAVVRLGWCQIGVNFVAALYLGVVTLVQAERLLNAQGVMLGCRLPLCTLLPTASCKAIEPWCIIAL
jgi:hypothetical protein